MHSKPPAHARLCTWAALALCALPATAQPQQGPAASESWPPAAPGTIYARADSAYLSGRPEEAWRELLARIHEAPDDYEALWRAARSALVIAIDTVGDYEQNIWLDPGRDLAQRAVELRPEGIEGLYFRAALTGRRAMNAVPSYAAELAQLAYEDANEILRLDPDHGGAHNVLGKLNYEVMCLPRLKRFFARLVMGNDAIREAGWDQAEYHLSKAVELWPHLVLFRYDLGALYVKRGEDEEARAALEKAIELPPVHPPDGRFKAQAEELLERLGG